MPSLAGWKTFRLMRETVELLTLHRWFSIRVQNPQRAFSAISSTIVAKQASGRNVDGCKQIVTARCADASTTESFIGEYPTSQGPDIFSRSPSP